MFIYPQKIKQQIATFLLIMMSIQILPIEGEEISMLEVAVMALSPAILLIFSRRCQHVKEIDNTGLQAMRVEVISGSFIFVDFNIFREIGYFFSDTFLYSEERFVANKAKRLGYKNYVLLDQTYIHNHSTTISAYHNLVSKHQMLYDGWLKYARNYRKCGLLKYCILRIASYWSLFEWWLIERINRYCK